DADRVHRVHLHWMRDGQPRSTRSVEFPRLIDFARETRAFDLVAGFQVRTVAFGQGDDTREGRLAVVTDTYLDFFEAAPVLGRWFTASDDQPPASVPVVVLSDTYWKTRYGARPDVLGETLQIDRLQATIIGVAPPGFTGIADAGAPLAFVPMRTFAHAIRGPAYDTSYNWSWLQVLVRRAPGVGLAEAVADLSRAYEVSWRTEDAARRLPSSLETSRPHSELGPVHLGRGPDAELDARVALWISGVALVVLLIACANVANLFLSRAVSQQREVAMRLALGVGRARLTRQLLVESLVLGVAGGVGGITLAWSAGGVFRALMLPDAAAAAVLTDPRTLVYACALAVLAGSLAALVPAVMAARLDVAASLKAGGRGTTRQRSRTQAIFVVVQAALSVVLLVGAALFVRSLQRAQDHRLGFDVEPLLYAEVNLRGERLSSADTRQLVERLLHAARAVPGVTHASMASSVPFWSNEGRELIVPGVDKVPELGRFTLQAGSGDYFVTTGTRLLRGRGFTDADGSGSTPVAVVSEGMARVLWPGHDALGQCIHVNDGPPDPAAGEAANGPCRVVVGVAEENAMHSLDSVREYTYYLPVAQFPGATSLQFFVRVDDGRSPPIGAVRQSMQALLPGAAYANVLPMRELVAPQLRAWRFGATMFVAFGGLALLVAALGLHSLVSYEVAQREQEFGVRLALGATRDQILGLVVGRGARLAAVGIAVGVVIALAASRPLEPLMFHQSARDPVVLLAVAGALIAFACFASAMPGLRATRVDPSVTLRVD
ncbi:MAG: FtsX-like permease family protein, partial [Acidobacteriota bacterium]